MEYINHEYFNKRQLILENVDCVEYITNNIALYLQILIDRLTDEEDIALFGPLTSNYLNIKDIENHKNNLISTWLRIDKFSIMNYMIDNVECIVGQYIIQRSAGQLNAISIIYSELYNESFKLLNNGKHYILFYNKKHFEKTFKELVFVQLQNKNIQIKEVTKNDVKNCDIKQLQTKLNNTIDYHFKNATHFICSKKIESHLETYAILRQGQVDTENLLSGDNYITVASCSPNTQNNVERVKFSLLIQNIIQHGEEYTILITFLVILEQLLDEFYSKFTISNNCGDIKTKYSLTITTLIKKFDIIIEKSAKNISKVVNANKIKFRIDG